MGDTVLYERTGRIGLIKLNRPRVLNAVNDALVGDFVEALRRAGEDTDARVLILKGEGRAFCAGADLKEGVVERPMGPYRKRMDLLQDIGRLMMRMDKPIIAAMHGYAVGAGFEFGINCDIRIASEDLRIFSPETGVGATVTTGATKLIPAIIGVGRAFELFFTGRRLNAAEALEWGLVNRVVPLEELDKTAMEMAEGIAENYPLSLSLTRSSVYHAIGASLEDVFDEEAKAACISFASGERKTGMKREG